MVAKGITGGHFMKYILSLLLITAMLLTLAACGGKTPYPGTTDPALSATANTQNDPQDALSALRADMKPPVIAVANFHFPELSDNFGIMDYLLDEYPNWMAENDFIRNMPDERVVITCGYEAWANLVCVVPYDPLCYPLRYRWQPWQLPLWLHGYGEWSCRGRRCRRHCRCRSHGRPCR